MLVVLINGREKQASSFEIDSFQKHIRSCKSKKKIKCVVGQYYISTKCQHAKALE
jgi:hypothetical protein